ncbi:hypothetical protein ANCCAN_05747 [Ancylostoma caninum]|uniref:Uncharacterized protein n=1 Tax=Ancylostoma caninum TaxID=29170 RepID=A0A368GV19_ANCCA|nr:hypothetical protein ANCCAN_05747 [Ancylostoma caninum]
MLSELLNKTQPSNSRPASVGVVHPAVLLDLLHSADATLLQALAAGLLRLADGLPTPHLSGILAAICERKSPAVAAPETQDFRPSPAQVGFSGVLCSFVSICWTTGTVPGSAAAPGFCIFRADPMSSFFAIARIALYEDVLRFRPCALHWVRLTRQDEVEDGTSAEQVCKANPRGLEQAILSTMLAVHAVLDQSEVLDEETQRRCGILGVEFGVNWHGRVGGELLINSEIVFLTLWFDVTPVLCNFEKSSIQRECF